MAAMSALGPSKPPENGAPGWDRGQKTCQAKKTARLAMTPTTAAVIAVSGATSRASSRELSTSGPPAKMKRNDGRKVKKVATHAPMAAAANKASGPSVALVQPPTKPTKATIMISGPGVVSPSASPSIICVAVAQPYVLTAPSIT